MITAATAGVVYAGQIGGHNCFQVGLEGHLVPVYGTAALAELREIFRRETRGWGARNLVAEEQVSLIAEAVAEIEFPLEGHGVGSVALELDETRLGDLNESWIPVATPDGPGVLVWGNSD